MTLREKAIATWGVGLVLLLLGQAVYRLSPLALEPWLEGSMTAFQITLYISWLAFNGYAEGYRGFQKRFSPRVVRRAFWLGKNATPLRVALALPFCMSLFHSTKRQKMVSWIFILAIVSIVVVVRGFPQPWRGIVDGGVVFGLLWGMVVIIGLYFRGLSGDMEPPPDLPEAADMERVST